MKFLFTLFISIVTVNATMVIRNHGEDNSVAKLDKYFYISNKFIAVRLPTTKLYYRNKLECYNYTKEDWYSCSPNPMTWKLIKEVIQTYRTEYKSDFGKR